MAESISFNLDIIFQIKILKNRSFNTTCLNKKKTVLAFKIKNLITLILDKIIRFFDFSN